jgi:cytochrome c oxidase assembly factor CtaG
VPANLNNKATIFKVLTSQLELRGADCWTKLALWESAACTGQQPSGAITMIAGEVAEHELLP